MEKVDIKARIIARMKEKGITRSELARQIGKPKQHITNYLNDSTNPPFDALERIFYVLDM
jgi:transcriptional regulator with XRE-family HTH domain